MGALILSILLRLAHPTCEPPPPLSPYTLQDWQREEAKSRVCQCLSVKISPEGNVLGTSRPCDCDE
jgi:hypothetical protein